MQSSFPALRRGPSGASSSCATAWCGRLRPISTAGWVEARRSACERIAASRAEIGQPRPQRWVSAHDLVLTNVCVTRLNPPYERFTPTQAARRGPRRRTLSGRARCRRGAARALVNVVDRRLFHFFDVVELPRLVEIGFFRPVEAEVREPALARNGFHPVLRLRRLGRAEVEVHRA